MQREIERLEELRQGSKAEYERALKAWITSDVKALVHLVFSSWLAELRESVRARDVEAAQDGMLLSQDAQIELAVKSWASSDAKSRALLVFMRWRDVMTEAAWQRDIAAVQKLLEMSRKASNAEYDRTLKSWASSDLKSL